MLVTFHSKVSGEITMFGDRWGGLAYHLGRARDTAQLFQHRRLELGGRQARQAPEAPAFRITPGK